MQPNHRNKSKVLFAGPKDWRQVAVKVRISAGWAPGCVYEDTLYPSQDETNAIYWCKIAQDTVGQRSKTRAKDRIDVNLWTGNMKKWPLSR